jgi:hypothetical protein
MVSNVQKLLTYKLEERRLPNKCFSSSMKLLNSWSHCSMQLIDFLWSFRWHQYNNNSSTNNIFSCLKQVTKWGFSTSVYSHHDPKQVFLEASPLVKFSKKKTSCIKWFWTFCSNQLFPQGFLIDLCHQNLMKF